MNEETKSETADTMALLRATSSMNDAKDELYALDSRPGFSPTTAALYAEVEAIKTLLIENKVCTRVQLYDEICNSIRDVIADNS